MDNTNLNYQSPDETVNMNDAAQDPLSQPMAGQDPLLTQPAMPQKKKISTGETIAATVGTVVLFKLFGLIGAAICFGGYAAIRAITKSAKLSTGAKVGLSILLGFVFVGLLVGYLVLSVLLVASMN